jgi:hypothetical protein
VLTHRVHVFSSLDSMRTSLSTLGPQSLFATFATICKTELVFGESERGTILFSYQHIAAADAHTTNNSRRLASSPSRHLKFRLWRFSMLQRMVAVSWLFHFFNLNTWPVWSGGSGVVPSGMCLCPQASLPCCTRRSIFFGSTQVPCHDEDHCRSCVSATTRPFFRPIIFPIALSRPQRASSS